MRSFRRKLARLLVVLMIINMIPQSTLAANAEGVSIENEQVTNNEDYEPLQDIENPEGDSKSNLDNGEPNIETEGSATSDEPMLESVEADIAPLADGGDENDDSLDAVIYPQIQFAGWNSYWDSSSGCWAYEIEEGYGSSRWQMDYYAGCSSALAFKCVNNADSVLTYSPLTKEDIKVTLDGDVAAEGTDYTLEVCQTCTLEAEGTYKIYKFNPLKAGEFKFIYTNSDDIQTYVTFTVNYPDVGFYSSANATADDLITGFTYSPAGASSESFYAFLCQKAIEDGYSFDESVLYASKYVNSEEVKLYANDEAFSDYYSITAATSTDGRPGYKITVKDDEYGQLTFGAKNELGSIQNSISIGMSWYANSLPALILGGYYFNQSIDSNYATNYCSYDISPNTGAGCIFAFEYCTGGTIDSDGRITNGTVTPITIDKLTITKDGVNAVKGGDYEYQTYTTVKGSDGKTYTIYSISFLKSGRYKFTYKPKNATESSVVCDASIPNDYGMCTAYPVTEATFITKEGSFDLKECGTNTVYFYYDSDRYDVNEESFRKFYYDKNGNVSYEPLTASEIKLTKERDGLYKIKFINNSIDLNVLMEDKTGGWNPSPDYYIWASWDEDDPQVYMQAYLVYDGETVSFGNSNIKMYGYHHRGTDAGYDMTVAFVGQVDVANNDYEAFEPDKYGTSEESLGEHEWIIISPLGEVLDKPNVSYDGKAKNIEWNGEKKYYAYDTHFVENGCYRVLYNAGTLDAPNVIEGVIEVSSPPVAFYSAQTEDNNYLIENYGTTSIEYGSTIYAFSHDDCFPASRSAIVLESRDEETGISLEVELSAEELSKYVKITECTDINDSSKHGYKLEFTKEAIGKSFGLYESITTYSDNGEITGTEDVITKNIDVTTAHKLYLADWFDYNYDDDGNITDLSFGHYGEDYVHFDNEDEIKIKGRDFSSAFRYMYLDDDGNEQYLPIDLASDKVSVEFTDYYTGEVTDAKAYFKLIGTVTADESMPKLAGNTYNVYESNFGERGTITISYEADNGYTYESYIYIEPNEYRLGTATTYYEEDDCEYPWTGSDLKLYLWKWDDNTNNGKGSYVKVTKAMLESDGLTCSIKYRNGNVYDMTDAYSVSSITSDANGTYFTIKTSDIKAMLKDLEGKDEWLDTYNLNVAFYLLDKQNPDWQCGECDYWFTNTSVVLTANDQIGEKIFVDNGGSVNVDLKSDSYWLDIPSIESQLDSMYNDYASALENGEAVAEPDYLNYSIKSSDSNVVNVIFDRTKGSRACLELLAPGKATITVYYSGKMQYSFDVNVTASMVNGLLGYLNEDGEFVAYKNGDTAYVEAGDDFMLEVNPEYSVKSIVPGSLTVSLSNDTLEFWDYNPLVATNINWISEGSNGYTDGYYDYSSWATLGFTSRGTGSDKAVINYSYKYTDKNNAVKTAKGSLTLNIISVKPDGVFAEEFFNYNDDGVVKSDTTGKTATLFVGNTGSANYVLCGNGVRSEDMLSYTVDPQVLTLSGITFSVKERVTKVETVDEVEQEVIETQDSSAYSIKVDEKNHVFTVIANKSVLKDYQENPEEHNVWDTFVLVEGDDFTLELPISFDETLPGSLDLYATNGKREFSAEFIKGLVTSQSFDTVIEIPYTDDAASKYTEGTDLPVNWLYEESNEFATASARVVSTEKEDETLKIKVRLTFDLINAEITDCTLAGSIDLGEDGTFIYDLYGTVHECPEETIEKYGSSLKVLTSSEYDAMDFEGSVYLYEDSLGKWILKLSSGGVAYATILEYIGGDTDKLQMPSVIEVNTYKDGTYMPSHFTVVGYEANVLGDAKIDTVEIPSRYTVTPKKLSSSESMKFKTIVDDYWYSDTYDTYDNIFSDEAGRLWKGYSKDALNALLLDAGCNEPETFTALPEDSDGCTWYITDTETNEYLYYIDGKVYRESETDEYDFATNKIKSGLVNTSLAKEKLVRALEDYTNEHGSVKILNDFTGTINTELISIAKFSSVTKYITIDRNGGKAVTPASITRIKGSLVLGADVKNPERMGYNFTGWFTEKDGGTQITAKTKVTGTEDFTIYAHWSPVTYSVVFNANDGGTRNVDSEDAAYYAGKGADITGIDTITNAGKATGKQATISAKFDTSYTLPECTYVRKGYDFVGWSTDRDGTGILHKAGTSLFNVCSFSGNVIGNITFYAIWRPSTYSITFDYAGAKANETVNYLADKGYTILPVPAEVTGYTFAGWYKDNTYKTKIETVAPGTSLDMTLYAKWLPTTYTVTLMNGDKVAATMSVPYNVATALTSIKAATGYKFAGWTYDEAGTVHAFNDKEAITFDDAFITEHVVSNNVTLHATWSNEYVVSFNSNGGSSCASTTYTYGEAQKLVLPTSTRAGYTFGGWYADSNFKTTAVKALTAKSAQNYVLYAKWTPNTVTVTYDKNGGTGSVSSQKLTYDKDTVKLNANKFKNTGYTFAGWNTAADGSGTVYTDLEDVDATISSTVNTESTSKVVLYAQWDAVDYHVTLHVNDIFDANADFGDDTKANLGISDNKYVYHYSTSAQTLPVPVTADGYTFAGWYTDAKLTKIYNKKGAEIAAKATTDLELYAKWTGIKYDITFDSNNSTATKTQKSLTQGIPATLTKNSFKITGYSFKGWSLERQNVITSSVVSGDNVIYYDENDSVVTIDYLDAATVTDLYTAAGEKATIKAGVGQVTLYAVWSTAYTVSFELNGGSGIDETPLEYNFEHAQELLDVLETPEKDGYDFGGWYTDAKFKTTAAKALTSKSATNYTLYAKWVPITYYVMFEGNNPLAKTSKSTVEKMTYDKLTALSANMYTVVGNKFMGWSLNDNAVYTDELIQDKEKVAFSVDKFEATTTYTVTAKNVTTDYKVVKLYAVWSDNFNITYNTNGGVMPDDYYTDYTYGAKSYKALPVPEREGYTFAGWYADAALKKAVKSITKTTAGDLDLYAKWTGKSYTVSYNANAPEGKKVSGKTGNSKLTFATEKALTKNSYKVTGYTFLGWSLEPSNVATYALDADDNIVAANSTDARTYYDEDGNAIGIDYLNAAKVKTVADSEDTYDAAPVLYAVWAKDTYTITWNAEGIDTSSYPETYDVDDAITLPAPGKLGYTFGGWYVDASCKKKASDIKAGSTGNKTFYAKWTLNK